MSYDYDDDSADYRRLSKKILDLQDEVDNIPFTIGAQNTGHYPDSFLPSSATSSSSSANAATVTEEEGGGEEEEETQTPIIPEIFHVRNHGLVGRTGNFAEIVDINLTDKLTPHFHIMKLRGNIIFRFLNIPSTLQAIKFIIEVTQNNPGGWTVNQSRSGTNFTVNPIRNTRTLLKGLIINGQIYIANFGKVGTSSTGNSISDLDEFIPAANNKASQLNAILGMELNNMGKVKFNTLLESSIGASQAVRIQQNNPNQDTGIVTSIEQVMSFFVNGESGIALSSQQFGGSLTNPPSNSVLEVFGRIKPSLKLVSKTSNFGNNGTNKFDLGSIYFDGQIPSRVRNVDFAQLTMAEIRSYVRTGRTVYPTWSSRVRYFRGDQVLLSGTQYIARLPSTNKRPSSSAGRTYWRSFRSSSINKGGMELILRDSSTSNFGSSADKLETMVDMSIDGGFRIESGRCFINSEETHVKGRLVVGSGKTATTLDSLMITDLEFFGGSVKNVVIEDDLEHIGSKVGLRGKNPTAGKTWAVSSIGNRIPTARRQTPSSYSNSTSNITLLIRAFATLIVDLKETGIIK